MEIEGLEREILTAIDDELGNATGEQPSLTWLTAKLNKGPDSPGNETLRKASVSLAEKGFLAISEGDLQNPKYALTPKAADYLS